MTDFLANIPLLAGLDPASLADLQRIATPFTLPPGTTLFRQGDPADGLYLVADGEIQVGTRAPGDATMRLAPVGAGGLVGELALLDGAPRAATAMAETGANGIFIPRDSFEAQVRDARPAAFALVDRVRVVVAKRIRAMVAAIAALPPEAIVAGGRMPGVSSEQAAEVASDWDAAKLLPGLAPYRMMTAAQAEALAGLGTCITLPRGRLLAQAGSPAHYLHIVLRGALRTAIPRGESCEQLLVHGPGDLVGLLALLDEGPLASELSVREEAVLLRIARVDFEALRTGAGEAAQALFLAANRQLVRDLRRLTRHLGRAEGLMAFNAGGVA